MSSAPPLRFVLPLLALSFCDLRTAVFSSDLQGAYTKILQGRKWEESMQEKTKVLVARASHLGRPASPLLAPGVPLDCARGRVAGGVAHTAGAGGAAR